ncbi:MAG: GNAT family N-acetyltransferase [Actinomycetes bacterium]
MASSEDPSIHLSEGAILRSAVPEDLPALEALTTDREGADDAVDLRLAALSPGGFERIGVVEVDGEVAATATLLNEQVRVGSVMLPAGQIELVASAVKYEHRGYVRALTDWCHDKSARRGDVVNVMIGIPNFYRQFGYHYSIPMHPWAESLGAPEVPTSLAVRVATAADLPTLQRLQGQAQDTYDVAMPHQQECWGWLLEHPSSRQWLVDDGDSAVGLARIAAGDDWADVGELAAATPDAARALIAHAHTLAGSNGTVRVSHRPQVPRLAELLGQPERLEWYYVRVPDVPALLRAIAPELLRRVHAAGRLTGQAVLSFYRSHLTLTWDADAMVVTAGGPLQAPVHAGGSGIPLDALGTLIFGGGADAVDARFPDGLLGRQEDLMRVLFPPQRTDLLTWYLPS